MNIPEVAIADVFKLGKIKGNRPVLVRFIAPRWVKLVFTKLVEFNRLNLSIANVRSKQEREERKELRKQEDLLLRAGLDASIKKNRLFVGEREIFPGDIETLLKSARKRKVGDEGNDKDRLTEEMASKRRGRFLNRDLLAEDKNNQSMISFLSPRPTEPPVKQTTT